jgi:hypothetical protein
VAGGSHRILVGLPRLPSTARAAGILGDRTVNLRVICAPCLVAAAEGCSTRVYQLVFTLGVSLRA